MSLTASGPRPAAARCWFTSATTCACSASTASDGAARAVFAARAYPQNGATALWVSSGTASIVGTPVRLGAAVVALLAAWRLRRVASEPGTLMAGLGVVFLARFLFEPVVYSYYLAPGLAFLLVHERIRTGRILRTVMLGGGWLLWFQVWPARWWWTCSDLIHTNPGC